MFLRMSESETTRVKLKSYKGRLSRKARRALSHFFFTISWHTYRVRKLDRKIWSSLNKTLFYLFLSLRFDEIER